MVLVTLILALVTNALAVVTPKAAPTNSPDCVKFYHQACSEAIGKWLPEMGRWYDSKSTPVPFTDAFVYEGRKPKWTSAPYAGWASVIPRDGTFFVYGNAGPPKGVLVYDYSRQIAFYEQGCCAWHEVVAAAGVSPPPKRVVSRNLSSLHTVRGVALGQTVGDVLRRYGRAPVVVARRRPLIERLSYEHMFDKNCGQNENFVFKNNRLIYIALLNSC